MTRYTTFLAAAALSVAAVASAHPKHEHRVMGTLTAVDEARIAIETVEGQSLDLATTETTKYERGGAAASRSDLAVGSRVVVFYMEDEEHGKHAVRILLPETPRAGTGD